MDKIKEHTIALDDSVYTLWHESLGIEDDEYSDMLLEVLDHCREIQRLVTNLELMKTTFYKTNRICWTIRGKWNI
jgi:hypothetical protein